MVGCPVLVEPDRLVLPFVMTGSGELLEALPRHETAHAALLTDILDVVHGSSLTAKGQSSSPQTEGLSPAELKVLRYLPTNLSRPEIASGRRPSCPFSLNWVLSRLWSATFRSGDILRAEEARCR